MIVFFISRKYEECLLVYHLKIELKIILMVNISFLHNFKMILLLIFIFSLENKLPITSNSLVRTIDKHQGGIYQYIRPLLKKKKSLKSPKFTFGVQSESRRNSISLSICTSVHTLNRCIYIGQQNVQYHNVFHFTQNDLLFYFLFILISFHAH